MSAQKREMQVVNMMAPDELRALFGYEPTPEDRAKFHYLAVEETPGAGAQLSRYLWMGYEIVKRVSENPVVTICRIPHEKRQAIVKEWEDRARDQARSADAMAKQSVSGEGTPFAQSKQVDTGHTLTLPG